MGMAASQARLLALTARMHDIEYKAQNLQAQKIDLATQEDAVYQKYLDALDATKITVAIRDDSGRVSYIDANYSNTCGYNPDNMRQYSLIDNKTGYVIVPEDIKENYEIFGNDKYSFAWAMLGFEGNFNWTGNDLDPSYPGYDEGQHGYLDPSETGIDVGTIGAAQGDPFDDQGNLREYYAIEDDGTYSLYLTGAEQAVFENHMDEDSKLMRLYEALIDSEDDGSTKAQRQKILDNFRDYLYQTYSDEIFTQMNYNKNVNYEDVQTPDFPDKTWGSIKDEFKYYINIWSQIKQAGGCTTIAEQYRTGEEGTEWFNNMITSGLVSIYMLDTNSNKGWVETSIATSVGNNYLQYEKDDDLVKKAEAEYEHSLKIINRKDTKLDTELKKLETEESACNTEIEGIKKVIGDNVKRTFGIFS